MLPAAVLAFADRGPDWAAFVDRLPRLVREISREWELEPDGAAMSGYTALVLPVVAANGPAVLKLGFPHAEAEHEHLALQHWQGQGAVRLFRADPHRQAMLLERLDARDLTTSWDIEACEIVGSLYRSLHVPAPPQMRTLSSYIEVGPNGSLRFPAVPHCLVDSSSKRCRSVVTSWPIPPVTER